MAEDLVWTWIHWLHSAFHTNLANPYLIKWWNLAPKSWNQLLYCISIDKDKLHQLKTFQAPAVIKCIWNLMFQLPWEIKLLTLKLNQSYAYGIILIIAKSQPLRILNKASLIWTHDDSNSSLDFVNQLKG